MYEANENVFPKNVLIIVTRVPKGQKTNSDCIFLLKQNLSLAISLIRDIAPIIIKLIQNNLKNSFDPLDHPYAIENAKIIT